VAEQADVDRHLVAVIDRVIAAVQETKQAVWQASTPEIRRRLNELKAFLAEQLGALADAEERLGGRDPSVTSPTGHAIRNLLAESRGDRSVFRGLILGELRAVAADARARAGEVAGAPEADLLVSLAEGIDRRLDELEAAG
jgi:hypothetical protein